MTNRLLSIQEVAEYLGVSPRTVQAWCQGNKIPHYKIGGRLRRFDKREIDQWLERKRK